VSSADVAAARQQRHFDSLFALARYKALATWAASLFLANSPQTRPIYSCGRTRRVAQWLCIPVVETAERVLVLGSFEK
jgi:hypothetical protein